MNDIHDIKPALEMGTDWGWAVWALAALAVAALALLAWWLWRRRRRPVDGPPAPPPISPEDEALSALDRLAAAADKDGKQFYFALSALLRRYVERRYAIPAVEMTLEELLPEMDRLALDPDLYERFKQLCRRAEPIKFADLPAAADQMPADLAFGREFVERTTAIVAEEEEGVPHA
jgi:hypothetical protein